MVLYHKTAITLWPCCTAAAIKGTRNMSRPSLVVQKFAGWVERSHTSRYFRFSMASGRIWAVLTYSPVSPSDCVLKTMEECEDPMPVHRTEICIEKNYQHFQETYFVFKTVPKFGLLSMGMPKSSIAWLKSPSTAGKAVLVMRFLSTTFVWSLCRILVKATGSLAVLSQSRWPNLCGL